MSCIDFLGKARGDLFFPIAAQVLAAMFAVVVTIIGLAFQIRGVPTKLVILLISTSESGQVAIGFYMTALFVALAGSLYPESKMLLCASWLIPIALILMGYSSFKLFESILGDKWTRKLTRDWVKNRAK